MTFNNLEIPKAADTLPNSTWYVYDGPAISVIHDGVSRYVYIKNIKTAVKFPEPNTSYTNNETAFIIGSNSTNLYFLNPNAGQLRTINVDGIAINEQYYNLNDFNKLKDISNGTSGNTFVPTCGHVAESTIVIGGYIQSVTSNLKVEDTSIPNEAACYMYSTDSGATFQGPYFPFINTATGSLYSGRVINCLFINDNWVFYVSLNLGSSRGTNLNFVQTLGVDLIGNNIFDPFLETPSASFTVTSLPMVYFDKKIYFQLTNKTGYYTYNYEYDLVDFHTLTNITGFSILPGELRITTRDDCNPVVIPALNEVGAVTITSFVLDNKNIKLNIGIGKTYIEETTENKSSTIFSSNFNTSHFLQPATLDVELPQT